MNETTKENSDSEIEPSNDSFPVDLNSDAAANQNQPPTETKVRTRPSSNLPFWLIGLFLVLALAYTIFHNFKAGREPGSPEETKKAEQMIAAFRGTKSIYFTLGMRYHNLPKNNVSEVNLPKNGLNAKKTKPWVNAYNPIEINLKEWKKLSETSSMSPGLWRKYGITLFFLGKPGGLAAFQHISDAPKTEIHVEEDPRKKLRSDALKEIRHPIPIQEESVLWNAIYGSGTLSPTQQLGAANSIRKLKLGWFEHLALAQFFHKQGDFKSTEYEARAAKLSCSLLLGLETLDIFMVLFGGICLIVVGIFFFLTKLTSLLSPKRQVLEAESIHDSRFVHDGIPGEIAFSPVPNPTPAAILQQEGAPQARPLSYFSYQSLVVSFLVYYLSFLIIVLPIRLMSPLWSSLNATLLHRLNLIIGLLLYVPIVAITVLTLRRLTEREKGRRIPLGVIWKALGFRFDQVGRDFGRGCLAYLALFPILTIAGALSHWIFNVLLKRYQFFTPINPAEIESMISNAPIDQILILIQTVVAAPIVEELMFRGLLFRGLRIKWGIVMAAVLSSMMFALSHNTLPNGFLTLWSIGMGFSFASIQRDRNSILPNIFMHAIHNGLISFMIALIFSK